MDPLQIIGSLAAILALAGLAAWLRLGGQPRLASEPDARRAANEAVDGFVLIRSGIDRAGNGAILEDEQGRLLLLKAHGNQFAGRLLGRETKAVIESGALRIDCGERRYGTVSLDLDDPESWAQAIDRLREADHA